MLGPETIRQMSDVAAYRAAEEGKKPLLIWKADDLHHLPFLGDYCPAGWRPARWSEMTFTPRNVWRDAASGRGIPSKDEVYFMVDSSGFGNTHEPALTFSEFVDYVGNQPGFGWAIREAGEFQVVVGAYSKDADAPETGLPSEESVTCESCHTVHDPFEECDEYEEDVYEPGCPACGDPIDYCQGHGEIGDPAGFAILAAHDDGDHSGCHPDGCDEAGQAPLAPGQERLAL